MLSAITLTLFFQVLGEIVNKLTGIPVPGPVLGMLFMLIAFFFKDNLIETVRPTAGILLANLSLLFVPAGVGLMRHGERFIEEGPAILFVILASSVLGMLTTAYSFLFIQKRLKIKDID